jgi:tetratricopeptide (TPR) repeat protein
MIYSNRGDYAKALEWYCKALAIHEKAFGKEHPDTAKVYDNIAIVYGKQGDYTKALAVYLKAYRISLNKLGESHPDSKMIKAHMGKAYQKTNPPKPFADWLKDSLGT